MRATDIWIVVGLRCRNHLVVVLSGTKKDGIRSDLVLPGTVAQAMYVYSFCIGLGSFQAASLAKSEFDCDGNAIMSIHFESQLKRDVLFASRLLSG